MSLGRYVARLRGPEGALAGRRCDGSPADTWHLVVVAWPDTVDRHAASLAALAPGAEVDLVAPESDAWCIPALEPDEWRRFEEMCRESRRRARGAEEPPPRLVAKPSTPKAPPERQGRGRTGRSIRPAGA